MEYNFIEYVNEYFKKFIELYGFNASAKINEKQSFLVVLESKYFVIEIEKYFREFYASLYKPGQSDNAINLFNLLGYLRRNDKSVPTSNYFHEEKDLEESYRKQLIYISSTIYENYDLISSFFNEGDLKLKFAGFDKYWKKRHPEFYKTSK